MLKGMSDASRLDTAQVDTVQETPQIEPAIPKVNPVVYQAVLNVTAFPVFLSGRRVDVHGLENIPVAGTPLVIASNHQNWMDPFIIARVFPRGRFIQFMAKKELFFFGSGHIIRAGGSFPVDRKGNDVGAIRTAMRILKNNGTVGIFPEGRRTEGLSQLHGGVALIAAKGRAPILPVGLSCDDQRWIVRFGEPISPRGGIKAMTTELAERLKDLSHPVGYKI